MSSVSPRFAFLILILVALAGARVDVGQADATLLGTVGSTGRIALTTAGGAPIRRLSEGSYRIVVRDRSRLHNFHLVGPGVDRKTRIASTAIVDWTVNLKPGDYTFRCDRHPRAIRKAFVVA